MCNRTQPTPPLRHWSRRLTWKPQLLWKQWDGGKIKRNQRKLDYLAEGPQWALVLFNCCGIYSSSFRSRRFEVKFLGLYSCIEYKNLQECFMKKNKSMIWFQMSTWLNIQTGQHKISEELQRKSDLVRFRSPHCYRGKVNCEKDESES